MACSLITKETVKLALEHITNFGDTDLFPPATEIDFFLKNQKDCVNTLKKIDQSILNNSYVSWALPSREVFFSFGQKPRVATQLPFLLTLYTTIHAFFLKDKIELIRLQKFDNCVFSYRSKLRKKNQMFSNNYGWNAFLDQQKKFYKDYQWVVSLDIAQFYSSIRKYHLNKIIKNFKLDKLDKRRIDYFFETTKGDFYGLPVGGDYSRLLAETTLYQIDTFIHKNDWKFCRFVDDYRIFFSNEQKAMSGSYKIIEALSDEGFQVNSTKLQIEKIIYKKVNKNLNTNLTLKLNNGKNSSIFFDPYSELVITKFKELKSITLNSNLLNLINLELEKIVPHIMSLKICISALAIDHKQNLHECFQKLLSTVFDKRYFALLPKIVRLTATIKIELKNKFMSQQVKYLTSNLMICHYDLPPTVIGQIFRIINLLSNKLSNDFVYFLGQALKCYKNSIFIQREILNLLCNKRHNLQFLVISQILKNPSLESAWNPKILLNNNIFDG
jgi:hypothetical protein